MEIKKVVEEKIDAFVNDLFCQVQDACGIESGDAFPEQVLALDDAKESLTTVMVDILEKQERERKEQQELNKMVSVLNALARIGFDSNEIVEAIAKNLPENLCLRRSFSAEGDVMYGIVGKDDEELQDVFYPTPATIVDWIPGSVLPTQEDVDKQESNEFMVLLDGAKLTTCLCYDLKNKRWYEGDERSFFFAYPVEKVLFWAPFPESPV